VTEAKVRRRSYSQLTTYLDCPEQYRLKYIEGHKEEPAVWNVGGTAFHSVAEWLLRGDVTADQITNAWQTAWQMAHAEVIERNPDANPNMDTWRVAGRGKETVAWWHRNGVEMCLDFADWRATKGKDLTVLELPDGPALEYRIEVELDGVPIVAIPDALVIDEYDQLCVLDYKTGRKGAPAHSLQLGVYRAAVLAATGLDATWGLFYEARNVDAVAKDLSVWRPEEIGARFSDFHGRVEAGQFPPNPGRHCRFCGVRDHCNYKET
jgi:RecB family exonuclease